MDACYEIKPDDLQFPIVHSRSTGSLVAPTAEAGEWQGEVRIGGGLIGVFPTIESKQRLSKGGLELKQVVTLTGRIEAFVMIKKGDTISYGGQTYHSQDDAVIGWLNLGYNDGLPSTIQGKPLFKYRKERCSIVGALGMNFSALDVTAPFSKLDTDVQQRLFDGLINAADDVIVLDGDEQCVEHFANEASVPHYSLLTEFGKGGLNKYVGELS